jgi:hypothetical protein
LKKLMLLAAMLAMVLVSAAPAAIGQTQPTEAKINDDVNSKVQDGKAFANAGGAKSQAEPCPAGSQAQSGDISSKAPCPPKAPPAPPKVMPPAPGPPMPPAPGPGPPPAPKPLPPTGGMGGASLLGLAAGALLVGGGLLVRRFVR